VSEEGQLATRPTRITHAAAAGSAGGAGGGAAVAAVIGPIAHAAVGQGFTALITMTGVLLTCGRNDRGQQARLLEKCRTPTSTVSKILLKKNMRGKKRRRST